MISMKNIDMLAFMDGIPDKEFEKTKALEYYKKYEMNLKKYQMKIFLEII